MALKTCEKCGNQQSTDNYYKRQGNLDGLYTWCKSCIDRKKKIENINGKSTRKSHLKHKYKINLGEYDRLFHKQCGYCYICLTHQDNLKRRLSVDHCHKTGEVRGLLCSNCNSAIGLLKDDFQIIERAVSYLKRFQEKQ